MLTLSTTREDETSLGDPGSIPACGHLLHVLPSLSIYFPANLHCPAPEGTLNSQVHVFNTHTMYNFIAVVLNVKPQITFQCFALIHDIKSLQCYCNTCCYTWLTPCSLSLSLEVFMWCGKFVETRIKNFRSPFHQRCEKIHFRLMGNISRGRL